MTIDAPLIIALAFYGLAIGLIIYSAICSLRRFRRACQEEARTPPPGIPTLCIYRDPEGVMRCPHCDKSLQEDNAYAPR